MELKERMYVRIKNEVGYSAIGKIENINDFREPMMKYCIDIQSNDFIFVPEDMIVKASNNIIDLIEVGDYVNGLRVRATYLDGINHYIKIGEPTKEGIRTYNEDIKSIVTKEQFEVIKYEVK